MFLLAVFLTDYRPTDYHSNHTTDMFTSSTPIHQFPSKPNVSDYVFCFEEHEILQNAQFCLISCLDVNLGYHSINLSQSVSYSAKL